MSAPVASVIVSVMHLGDDASGLLVCLMIVQVTLLVYVNIHYVWSGVGHGQRDCLSAFMREVK